MESEEPKRHGGKRWQKGVDMRPFSGRSWQELENIWPRDMRLASDVWKVMALFPPAEVQNRRFQKALIGVTISTHELCTLAWVQRCEEARENVATETYWMDRGLELNRRMANIRMSNITKLGLIEELPAHVRLYRVSDLGKTILRNLVEEMEKAHQNIQYWADSQPEEGKEKVNDYLTRYCFDWRDLDLKP